MRTKRDLLKFENRFVTKEYLDRKIARLMTREDLDNYDKRLKIYLDARFKPLEEMRKDFHDFKDRVLKTLDWLVGAFKKFDQEHTILTARYSDVQTRLTTLEAKK